MKNLFTNPEIKHFLSRRSGTSPETLKFKNWRFLLVAIIAFLVSPVAFSQIVIDGNPGDWANFQTQYGTDALLSDPVNSQGNTDNQFTGGSKDGSPISGAGGLKWSLGKANDKGDIANAGAALDGCTMYFFADRGAVNGDAAIGFWFYRNEVSTNANGTFSGVHTDGDVLVVSHFTNGGGQSDIFIYTAANGLTFEGSYTTAMVNTALYPSSGNSWNLPWSYQPKFGALNTYPTGSFFEGSINLCDIFDTQTAPCFASFLAETRNSQTVTAALQDFALGNFSTDVARPLVTVTQADLCGSGLACVTIVGTQVGSYTMSQPDNSNYGTNGSRTIQCANNGDVVQFCDLAPGGKFSVYYATSSGCISVPTDCDNYIVTRQAAPSIKPQSALGKTGDNELSAYPVPFSESVTVEFKASKAENYVINLYDLQGHLVRELKAGKAKAGEVIKVDVSGSGMVESMYLVRKESKSGTSTVKLLKKE